MSQRGRGPESLDEGLDGDDAIGTPASAAYPVPPTASRPIAPYDPYRPPSGDAPRLSRRNVAADDAETPVRRPARAGDRDPFLPDDDPLSAEAWQLELEEIDDSGPGFEEMPPGSVPASPPAPRRARRQAASTRTRRESGSPSARPPRRSRSSTTAARERPAVTLGMPRAVSGSSLMTDQTMLALLGINAASILVMALLLSVRLGGLPSSIVLQLNAAGNPGLWGPPSVLWRLPVMSLFLTAMFLIVAWFLHPIDRFAARFALAAAVVAQVVAWVAVMQHLA